jgi:hypothetical protein
MHHNIPGSAGLVCSQQAAQRVPARAVGCFKINAGNALTLTPNAPGELRIAHGRVWVTFGHAADDALVRAGDYFLGAGDLLRLLPGQQLVIEPCEKDANESVYFSWEPDTATQLAASPRRVQHAHAEVRQPLLDLGTALQNAGKALGRLVQGLAAHLVCTLTLRRGMP